jgi:hypothetical protein
MVSSSFYCLKFSIQGFAYLHQQDQIRYNDWASKIGGWGLIVQNNTGPQVRRKLKLLLASKA